MDRVHFALFSKKIQYTFQSEMYIGFLLYYIILFMFYSPASPFDPTVDPLTRPILTFTPPPCDA